MNGRHKIGLFRVYKLEEFEGTVDFKIKRKYFLTYDRAFDYVLEAFKKNGKCMPLGRQYRYTFPYDREDPRLGYLTLWNSVKIEMVLPFYLHIGKEWF
jgi:hypothetical protein